MGGQELKSIIFLLIVLTLSAIVARYAKRAEHFVTAGGTKWLSDNPLLISDRTHINNIYPFDVTRWPSILAAAPSLPIDLVRDVVGGVSTLLMADPQDAQAHYGTLPQILMPKGYFVAVTSLVVGFKMDCGYDLVGKTIGYTDRASLLFVLSLLHGHRISLKAVRLVNVPRRMWKQFDRLLSGPLQIIATYIIPDSSYTKLLVRQNVNIMGFQRLMEDRLRLTMPTVTVESVSLASIVEGGRARVLARERTTMLPTLQMVAVVLNGPAPPTLEGFSSEPAPALLQPPSPPPAFVERPKDDGEPQFTCYGDETIQTPTACESPYDVSGLRKPNQTVWDKKCTRNDECPYFTGTRGGCDAKSGECELPVGAKRLSFRKADIRTPFQPFCYNADSWDLTGCSGISNPKWAFKGDKGYIDLRPTANEILALASST